MKNLSCEQQAEGKKNSEYNSERVLDTHDTQSEWTVGNRPVYLILGLGAVLRPEKSFFYSYLQ